MCTEQVDLYENGTIAIVEAVSPELGNRVQRVRVQLPGTSQELLQRFREKSVDFAAHSNTEDGGAVFLNLLGVYLEDSSSCWSLSWSQLSALARSMMEPCNPRRLLSPETSQHSPLASAGLIWC